MKLAITNKMTEEWTLKRNQSVKGGHDHKLLQAPFRKCQDKNELKIQGN